MSSMADPIAELERCRLVSIVRMDEPGEEIARALLDAGVSVVELSLVSAGALATLSRWRERFPELVLGAGTVLDGEACARAIEAGASFLISPGLEPSVAEVAREAAVPYIPGALTATEIGACLAEGAQLVKLFPALPLGPAYLSQLLGPFPHLRLLPTGGVTETSAPAFLAAGAVAVAVGSSIVGPGSTYDSVRSAAARMVDAIAANDKGDASHAD
jgi:2-dehydro-3-deoxyphosphogluconate aldolase/(4S)-4-hydroxy-2-oxoglutarate aldolase